ncbi:hypothetical protein Pelo_12128 [Pelomyxa schiedti]|nr:hypothetical protein Pelo_12128 [Pelomyxa schiedti]
MKTSCARRELKDLKEARSAITDGTRHRKLLRMQMGELETLSAFAKALIERKEWELQVADAKPADLEGEEDARWEYLDAKSQASLRKFFEGIRVIQCHNELSLSDDQSFSGVIMFEVSGGNAQVFMFSVGDVSVGERNGKVESGEIRLGFCVMNRGDPIPPPPLSEMATYGSIPKPWLPLAKRDYYSEWHAWSMNSSHTRKESLATSPVKQLLVLSACPNETDRQRMCWLNLVACCAGASAFDETFIPPPRIPPPPKAAPKPDYGHRAKLVAREIVTTEASFVTTLSKHRLYIAEAKLAMTPSQFTTIFKSMEALQEAHGRLSEQFYGIPEETLIPDLLAVFIQWMKTADLYNVYLMVGESYACGYNILATLKAKNPTWAKFLKDLDFSATMEGLNLETLLKAQDMKRNIGVPCPEIDTIITALRELADFVNKALQTQERIREALQLAPKLVHYKAYLMSDVLLACKHAKKKVSIPIGRHTITEPAHHTVVIQLQYCEGLYEVYHGPVRKHPKDVGMWCAPVCIRRTADTPTATATATGKGTGKGKGKSRVTGTGTGTGKGTSLQIVDCRGEIISKFVESLARLCYQSFDWRGSAAAFMACSLPRAGARCRAAALLNGFCLTEIARCLLDFRTLQFPFEVQDDDPLLL